MVVSEVLPEVNKGAAMDVIMFAELLHEDFVSCGANEFTSPIDSFVLLTWILNFLEETKK
jgi:hypothetical protein